MTVPAASPLRRRSRPPSGAPNGIPEVPKTPEASGRSKDLLAPAALFCAAMIVVALAAHRAELLPLRIGGCVAGAAAIAWLIARSDRPRRLAGLERPRISTSFVAAALVLVGSAAVLASVYRESRGLASLPSTLGPWGGVVALIGLAEELGYRGLVQGAVERWSAAAGVVLAAAAHATYKTALFVLPDGPRDVDLVWLAGATLGFGLLLGLARWRTGSVLLPALSHVVFDVVAYGDVASLPWWVA